MLNISSLNEMEKITKLKKNLNYRKAKKRFFNFTFKIVVLSARVLYICL
jgi:hypothetical protein